MKSQIIKLDKMEDIKSKLIYKSEFIIMNSDDLQHTKIINEGNYKISLKPYSCLKKVNFSLKIKEFIENNNLPQDKNGNLYIILCATSKHIFDIVKNIIYEYKSKKIFLIKINEPYINTYIGDYLKINKQFKDSSDIFSQIVLTNDEYFSFN